VIIEALEKATIATIDLKLLGCYVEKFIDDETIKGEEE
jgi:hypothetical protein